VGDKPHDLKAVLLQHTSRTRVLGPRESLDFRQPEKIIRDCQAGCHKFGPVTAPPDLRMEEVRDLDTSAGIEGIVVKAAPTDNPAVGPG